MSILIALTIIIFSSLKGGDAISWIASILVKLFVILFIM